MITIPKYWAKTVQILHWVYLYSRAGKHHHWLIYQNHGTFVLHSAQIESFFKIFQNFKKNACKGAAILYNEATPYVCLIVTPWVLMNSGVFYFRARKLATFSVWNCGLFPFLPLPCILYPLFSSKSQSDWFTPCFFCYRSRFIFILCSLPEVFIQGQRLT